MTQNLGVRHPDQPGLPTAVYPLGVMGPALPDRHVNGGGIRSGFRSLSRTLYSGRFARFEAAIAAAGLNIAQCNQLHGETRERL